MAAQILPATEQPAAPAAGDIVVTARRYPPIRYCLRSATGKDQLAFKTREEATAPALSWASRAQVDAWFTKEGVRFERIGAFRTLTSGQAPRRTPLLAPDARAART